MERHLNRQYQKLKVKSRLKQNSSKSQTFPSLVTVQDAQNKDAGNYKIYRFMKDVKKYGRSSTADEADDNDNFQENGADKFHHGNSADGKDKGDKERKKKQKFRLLKKAPLKEKVGFNGKFNANKREGLFQRGIITKDFNKGLIPPSLNARINEDLKKMIKLASGKYNSPKTGETHCKYRRAEDDNWNRITSFNSVPPSSDSDKKDDANHKNIDQVFFDEEIDETNMGCGRLSENPQKAEAEVQVSCPIEVNGRAREDLYVKFTHFVTQSLFNSGIDNQKARGYSGSLKESLVEIYRNRVKDKDVEKCVSHDEIDADDLSCLQEEPDSVKDSQTSPVIHETCHYRPQTSRSVEAPSKKKLFFVNNSQLSDDIVVRKPKVLYTSGIEYLKAVYGSKTESDSSHSKNLETEFSPVQDNLLCTKRQELFSSEKNDLKTLYRTSYEKSMNRLRNTDADKTFSPVQRDFCDIITDGLFSSSCKNDNHMPLSPVINYNQEDVINNNYRIPEELSSEYSMIDYTDKLLKDQQFSNPLQYIAGRHKTEYSWNRKQCNPFYPSTSIKSETHYQQDKYDSPEYISLLPAGHKLNHKFTHQSYSAQQAENEVPTDESEDCLIIHQSVLSLPKHLPPRKSPEIQYFPRRMF